MRRLVEKGFLTIYGIAAVLFVDVYKRQGRRNGRLRLLPAFCPGIQNPPPIPDQLEAKSKLIKNLKCYCNIPCKGI